MNNLVWKVLLYLLMLIPHADKLQAQDTVWSLQRCMRYAKENNLSIQNAIVNERIAGMQVQQSKMALLPNVSLSSSYGKSFGRSINPTSNQFENNTYEYTGLSGGSSVVLFNGFKNRNIIRRNKLQNEVATADKEQIQNDVTLNIAAAYLQVLLAKEQITTSEEQLKLSNQNIVKTNALREAGKSNGLDLAQVKAQLMKDSAAYYNALLEYSQSIIEIKAILNLSFATPFTPIAGTGNSNLNKQELDPEKIYSAATDWLPLVKSARLKIVIAEKDIAIAKGSLYPSLSVSYSFGSNYSSTFYEYLPNGERRLMNWGKQLQNNLAQSFSVGVNIPVFSNLSNRYAIKQSTFALRQSRIKQEEELLKLRQNIYKACNDARTARQVYYASMSATEFAATGYEFALERYGLGLISAADLLLAQRDRNLAVINELTAKYDGLFKMKVVEYYLHHLITE